MRLVKSNSLLKIAYQTGINYPAPINLSYFWNFGVYALICLIVQILTGVLLAMHYAPEINLAFASVEHIMRDVNYGWLLRYIHANGASMFFIVVYVHTFRGLYYSSYVYPRQMLWVVGVIILFAIMATAFLGYVLPWGQMSFWGATVITNLISAVPFVGKDIVIWLWGGFAINNATLNRFFSLHFLLPFIIVGLVAIHILFLHEHGSSNPLGIMSESDKSPFTPYYTSKDLYGSFIFLLFFAIFVFFLPNTLGHPDNYIIASPLVTPPHIVPEWYFLPFYAILRSIPDKLGGVLAIGGSIAIFAALPFYLKPEIRSMSFRPLSKVFFWLFLVNCFLLGWIGGKPVESPYLELGQAATIMYFFYFIVLIPTVIWIENNFWNNNLYIKTIFRYYALLNFNKKRFNI